MPNTPDDAALVARAIQARSNAYAPYSQFAVGAALMGASGTVYDGCNVENAAYPVTLCAERNAVGSAIAAGERSFSALAVVADTDRPVPPCGMCRQVLFEFAPDMRVVLTNLHGDRLVTTPRELLPGGFVADDLRADRQTRPVDES